MLQHLFFSITLLLLSFTANAGYYATPEANCNSVDLRPKDGSMKIRDQNRLSWCYAYTTSDFLQHRYQLPEAVSAIDVATTYGQNGHVFHRIIEIIRNIIAYNKAGKGIMKIDPAEQGFLKVAIKDMIRNGYCPESVFPSDAWIKRSKNGASESIEVRQAIRESIELSQLIQMQVILSPDDLPYYYELPNFTKEQYFDLLAHTHHTRFLPDLQSQLCDGKRKPIFSNRDEKKLRLKLRGKRVFNRINAALDEKQVASVDFYAGMFLDRKNFSRRLGDLHTVLVMGRTFDPSLNECRYLVRDTHGTECVSKGSHSSGIPFDSSLNCDSGYLWIPESSLYSSMVSYSYYDPKIKQASEVDTTTQKSTFLICPDCK